MKKIHFFVGKGGVGKSTLASVAAIAHVRESESVELFSFDPAHNLNDIFCGDRISGLNITELDIKFWLKKYITRIERDIARSYRYLTAFNLEKDLQVLRLAPGIEEYALLNAFHDLIRKAKAHSIILIDMPPTALSLKFFNLPLLTQAWIDKLIDLRRRIIQKKQMITRVSLGKTEIQTDRIMTELQKQKRMYAEIMSILRDTRKSRIEIILNPDPLSLKETTEIVAVLNELQIPLRRMIINRSDASNYPKIIRKTFPDINIIDIEEYKAPLTGIKNLEQFLKSIHWQSENSV